MTTQSKNEETLNNELTSSKHLAPLKLHLVEETINLNHKEKKNIDLETPLPFSIKTSKTMLLPLLRKFIYILKKETGFYKLKSLNQKALELINDNSHFSTKIESSLDNRHFFYKNFLGILIKTFKFYRILEIEAVHPYNNLKIIWDMMHFIIILLLLFLIPIDVCFKQDIEQQFEGFLTFFFATDILISMNTKYFNRGFIVKERKMIIMHYLKYEFFADVLSAVLYLVHSGDHEPFNLLKLVFCLRWQKLNKISLKLQEKFKIGLKLHASVVDLINLIFFSFYILNIFACFWYYIAFINEGIASNTWLKANNLQDEPLTTKYFYSFYWSCVTIMTVGYGDITAKNLSEVIFSSFTVFFGCGLFAYFINSVGAIVQDITKESHIFKTKLAVINKYMEKKNIDYNLQMKIREYLRFIWQEESTQNSEIEKEIIEKLSKSLRSELIFESYGQVLKESPLFFANFSEKFLGELMYEFQEVRNIPEDSIFKQNQIDDCEMYFIVKGKVELYHTIVEDENSGINPIQILKEGESFGESAFFTGRARSCYAKSNDFTTLFVIKREDFLKLLLKNPEDYEKFCMIRDQIIHENKLNFLQTKCFACSLKDHISINCPLIHYIPDKIKIVKRYMRDPGQKKREPFKRTRPYKFNSLYSMEYVKNTNQRFREICEIYYDEDEKNFNEFGEFSPGISNSEKMAEMKQNFLKEENLRKSSSVNKFGTEFSSNVFSQNFIKEPTSPLIIQGSYKEFTNQMMESVVMEKISGENICSVLNSPSLNEISEYEEIKQEQINVDQSVLISNLEAESQIKLPEKQLPTNFRKKRMSVDNYLEIPSQSLQKNFTDSPSKPALRKKITITSPELKLNNRENEIESAGLPLGTLQKPPLRSIPDNNDQNSIEKSEFNDLFQKEFEKGVNFKNFYPDSNLNKILETQRNQLIRIRSKVKTLRSPNRSPLNKSRRKSIKINKIIPEEVDNDKKSPSRMESISKKESKQYSNIFMKKQDTKFFDKKKKMSFYDVVNEILYNNELRKKLELMKKHSLKSRKTLKKKIKS